MSIFRKILQSVRDGSLPVRVWNRFSKVEYIPRTEKTTAEIISTIYPGDGWKKLSVGAQANWVKFHEVFESQEIRNIIWVGAHKGVAAVELSEAFPNRKFYVFEPVPDTYRQLCKTIEGHANIKSINMAAGAVESEMEMFVDECSASSSLLAYEQSTLKEWPFLGKTKKEKVQVRPLDKIMAELKVEHPDFLVVDTQGYEDAVFAGAKETLSKCKVVLVEMNVRNVYQNSSTFDSVYQVLRSAGLKLRHITHIHRGQTGAVLQIDGVFVRE